ncbi:hypothetical protein ACFQI3_13835 [Hansschlegelia quercus]|uniref:Hpt domain-containing protein n=1 Tax=Hansschlegelia quercus TaxID=2528245 RepID=A0A4Q9GBZ3_9HYPH|nr:hypothetical protein [Hansschlegelia quercus]TBN48716.1 hypothetical protein EYR15_14115 [Hansschlegelia quercus]
MSGPKEPLTRESLEPVPIQVFDDHMVLRPPNRLKERSAKRARTDDGGDRTVISRAENALKLLSQEFDAWMTKELDRLEEARRTLASAPSDAAADRFYRSAHDLRGQAATFGFPIAGLIADGLCIVLERKSEISDPTPLIDFHVESIRAVVRQNVREPDDSIGLALVDRLAVMRERALPA